MFSALTVLTFIMTENRTVKNPALPVDHRARCSGLPDRESVVLVPADSEMVLCLVMIPAKKGRRTKAPNVYQFQTTSHNLALRPQFS